MRATPAYSQIFAWTPEAGRMRSALDMHEFGVRLYRQRMHREHPESSHGEIESMVRDWLTAPSSGGRLRLPSRGHGHGYPVESALRRAVTLFCGVSD